MIRRKNDYHINLEAYTNLLLEQIINPFYKIKLQIRWSLYAQGKYVIL